MKQVLSTTILTTILATCLAVCPVASADWFQFQGENRDGTSPETGLMRAWPESGLKELWTYPLGSGYAGPAVRDGEVYVLDRVDEREDVLRCLDLNTGKELWHYAYDAPGSVGHSGSRTVPTIDEHFVYTVGMMGDLVCVDRKTHKPAWARNLFKDFDVKVSRWGAAQSPTLHGNLVIVAAQSSDAFIVAFDRKTGKLVWKSTQKGGVGYSPPVVTTLAGMEQAVTLSAYGDAAGVSLEDGKTLWTYGGWQCKIPIPYPTTLPGDRLFITGGYNAGSVMLRIKRDGAGFSAEELFATDECGSQIHQPLFYENHIYVNSNSNERQHGMQCMTLDGEVKWRTKDTPGLPLFERGNLILADNMIINLDGKTGVLHLIDPSPDGYKELGQAKVLDSNKMWSPMALSHGKLLVRGQEQMKCLDLLNP
jgi:PQQ-like domain